MISRATLLGGFLLLFLGGLTGQREVYHYASDHPLARGTIQDLTFDSSGYLWIGGQSSLRRFDGDRVDYFGNRREDTTDLSGDYIEDLFVDRTGRLWVGQQNGLSVFDPDRETFDNFAPPGKEDRRIIQIAEPSPGQLWVASSHRLYHFDSNTKRFVADTILQRRRSELETGPIRSLLAAKNDRLLVLTENALFSVNVRTSKMVEMALPGGVDEDFRALITGDDDELLLAARHSLVRLKEEGKDLRLVDTFSLHDRLPDHAVLTSLYRTAAGEYWLGATDGLFYLNWPEVGPPTVRHYTYLEESETGLSANRITGMSLSVDGVLLIGTERGVDRIDLNPPPFPVLRKNVNGVDLCHNVTKGLAYDEDAGLLVIGTQAGLSLLNPDTGEGWCYDPESLPGLRTGYLFNVDPGPFPATYWLGYRNEGTNLLDLSDPANPKIREVDFGNHDPRGGGVYEATVDPEGVHWLATSRGLLSYNPISGQSENFNQENTNDLISQNVLTVLSDSRGRLWLGTLRGGLCVRQVTDGVMGFDCFTYEEHDPTTLPSDIVLSIHEDNRGRIWISTPEALVLYLEDGKFHTFGWADGLDYTFNYGVFSDRRERLWTLFGGNLCQFDYSDTAGFRLNREISRIDGLASMPNTQHGWLVLPDGRIVVTGRNGVSIFDPESEEKADRFPEIILTDFYLFNRPVGVRATGTDPFAPEYTLPADVNHLTEIELPVGMNYPGFTFSVPEYRRYRQPHFSWKMTDIQEDWIDLEETNRLSFPRLPPGTHTLEIRTGNGKGDWSATTRKIRLHLMAPWYERGWAKGLFVLLSFGAIAGSFRIRERRRRALERVRTTEREELRRHSARDFHDEAGSHLTRSSLLISVLSQELGRGTEAYTKITGLLSELDTNVQRLREGMRDFIWAIDPDQDNAGELALRLKRFGQELFTHHPARFEMARITADLQHLPLRSDERRHLLLIAKEAMHNSLRHALTATRVELTILAEAGQLLVRWRDDGDGWGDEMTPGMGTKSICQRAEQINAQVVINGGSGYLVEIRLPVKS